MNMTGKYFVYRGLIQYKMPPYQGRDSDYEYETVS